MTSILNPIFEHYRDILGDKTGSYESNLYGSDLTDAQKAVIAKSGRLVRAILEEVASDTVASSIGNTGLYITLKKYTRDNLHQCVTFWSEAEGISYSAAKQGIVVLLSVLMAVESGGGSYKVSSSTSILYANSVGDKLREKWASVISNKKGIHDIGLWQCRPPYFYSPLLDEISSKYGTLDFTNKAKSAAFVDHMRTEVGFMGEAHSAITEVLRDRLIAVNRNGHRYVDYKANRSRALFLDLIASWRMGKSAHYVSERKDFVRGWDPKVDTSRLALGMSVLTHYAKLASSTSENTKG